MKIIVLVKQVPDTWGERKLDTATSLLDRGASEAVIDEIDERAVEVALSYRDNNKDAEVLLLTMGPAPATDVLRKGLAMGADAAVHLLDEDACGFRRDLDLGRARGRDRQVRIRPRDRRQ